MGSVLFRLDLPTVQRRWEVEDDYEHEHEHEGGM